jgi:hypothetical protein
MIDCQINVRRAVKHMQKAIRRGDLEAAFRWMAVADHQIRIARNLSDLRWPRHRPQRR